MCGFDSAGNRKPNPTPTFICYQIGELVVSNPFWQDWLKCDECAHVFFCEDTSQHEVYCEECGEHFAGKCPKCDNLVDIVFNTVDAP